MNLIERLAAAKDQFPAGSEHRAAIWEAIERLRHPDALEDGSLSKSTAKRVDALRQDDQFVATVIDARQTWIDENPGEDGRDQVTPFDKFLYGTSQTTPLCEECGIELGERIGALVVKRD